MAFGFGFNKQKVLNAAEKFVQQGKLQNAITEYEKILKADAKDLTVLNTVGDLYSRSGQSDKAVECFKNVGDAYAAQGFTVKAIAMYKKLSKLKPSLECVLRLAELYTQQGLFNDARAQYKQVAEEFLRTGELDQAVRIFQKILEMDPENVVMRTKLAEVYVRLGKKTEAWQIFGAAVASLRARGAAGPAEEIVQRMLTLDPGNSQALLLRGEMVFEAGDTAGAIQYLEKVADLDSHPDGLRTLMQAYLQNGRLAEAEALSAKLFSVHGDLDAIISYADALVAADRFEDALQLYQQYSEPLLASNPAQVLDTLHALIGHIRENTAALETLLALLNKAGDSTHLTEVYELLAHACVQSGELEKARGYYQKLTQLEPQNPLHARNYLQVAARLGTPSGEQSLITVEEGATLVDELEATAPFIEQLYPDEVALAVRAALTDAELFASYNMPAKALGPLLAVLPMAEKDLRLNQRLAALHTRAGRFAEAAVCCRRLEVLYHDAGHPDEATRYGELAGKCEARISPEPVAAVETSGLPATREVTSAAEAEPEATAEPVPAATDIPSPTPVAAAPRASGLFWHAPAAVSWPTEPPQPRPDPEAKSTLPSVEREIDLSEEWEGALSDETSKASSPAQRSVSASAEETIPRGAGTVHDEEIIAEIVSATAEEIRFYLAHSMLEQAQSAFAKLKELQPDAATLSAIEEEVNAAAANSLSAPAEEVSIEEVETLAADGDSEPALETEAQPSPRPISLPVETSHHAPPPQHAAALGDFVADLESSLGDEFLPAAPKPQAAPRVPLTVAQPVAQPKAKPALHQTSAAIPAPVSAAPASRAAAASAGDSAIASPTFTYQAKPSAPSRMAPSQGDESLGVDVAAMFGDLKQELEDNSPSANEDSETHYNLGVAFREMGLLDEAIGEFQKVCQAVDRGHPFPQLMQTYTWLAQCFLDKGVPEAAVRWYQKALQLPGLDGETCVALHYELAGSFEAAQNKPAALKHFLEVYGNNIDYRDVAERIKALKS